MEKSLLGGWLRVIGGHSGVIVFGGREGFLSRDSTEAVSGIEHKLQRTEKNTQQNLAKYTIA